MIDPEKARMNELYFMEIYLRISAFDNSPNFITTYFTALKYLFPFRSDIIIPLANEILDRKYIPTRLEVEHVFYNLGYSKKDLQRDLGLAFTTVAKHLSREMILYPRSTPVQQIELDKFITNYYKLFKIDIKNILLII